MASLLREGKGKWWWGRGGLSFWGAAPHDTILCRDSTDPGNMKEEGGSDLSVRSRKRKANVAVVSTKDTGCEGDSPPFHLTWVPNLGSSHLLVKRIS